MFHVLLRTAIPAADGHAGVEVASRVEAASLSTRVGRLLILAIVPLVLGTAGCEEKRIEVFPVSGRVTYQGKPPAGAVVVLHPVATSPELEGVAPSGTVGGDGAFTITVYDPGDGAPPGDYVATIQWRKYVPAEGGAGPNVLPEQYASAATSPVKISVEKGPTQIPPIAIK